MCSKTSSFACAMYAHQTAHLLSADVTVCCWTVYYNVQVGLHLLIADRRVFACHKDRWDTIFYSELGSSKAILDAGFNIGCMMLRYQGVDWRDPGNWDCNAR